jgi:hypothetical protein
MSCPGGLLGLDACFPPPALLRHDPANLVIRSRLVCIHRNTAPLKICIPGFEAALLPDK